MWCGVVGRGRRNKEIRKPLSHSVAPLSLFLPPLSFYPLSHSLSVSSFPSFPLSLFLSLQVITGQLDSLEREECEALITKYAGRVTKAVSGKTSYLVAGGDAGESKLRKAQQKGTKIVDEDGLFELIKKSDEKSAPKLTAAQKKKKELTVCVVCLSSFSLSLSLSLYAFLSLTHTACLPLVSSLSLSLSLPLSLSL